MDTYLKDRLLKKAKDFYELGYLLVATNRFLKSGYVDSDEPFPPTPEFMEATKKDAKTFPSSLLKFLVIKDPANPVELDRPISDAEKARLMNEIGIGDSFNRSAKKKNEDISYLLDWAESAFYLYRSYHIDAVAKHFSEDGSRIISSNEDLPKTVAFMLGKFEDKADAFYLKAHRHIGFLKADIKHLRQSKNGAEKRWKEKKTLIEKARELAAELWDNGERALHDEMTKYILNLQDFKYLKDKGHESALRKAIKEVAKGYGKVRGIKGTKK